ncbi:hypothetical protein DFH11DRAFT_1877283 [Phellopilus nigrolimitatus]|nr:hypothetical protein DFH11DRAFT_1877283 [Phellopilus nigrolimitatus]
MGPTLVFLWLAIHVLVVAGQTWCGKHYMANQSVVEPGGEFPVAKTSSEPLLAFRCAPAVKPYLAEDTSGAFIVDTQVTYTEKAGTAPIDTSKSGSELQVSISINGQTLATGAVPFNASGHELPFSLAPLKPQTSAFDVVCTAKTPDGQTFNANTTLQKLPDPPSDIGSVAKLDLRTGAMLVRSSGSEEWETVFPLGFYTTFDGYLTTNLSVLNDLKDRGFTIVHPVPTFDNLTALGEVLDRMEEVGLYLMYDMRFTYTNLSSVTEQVNMIKSRKNLLLWYTGDEPDGTSDPLNATKITYDLINTLDGYHPVSLVLNCENYFFEEYTTGADVVMQDAYPVAMNATFSVEWHTPCTPDFGDCGCDNCKGDLADIAARLDEFAYRLDVLGQTRAKAVWGVPQAFGGEEYWSRPPTGKEWLVEGVLSINHGATGIVPWIDPTPADIKETATSLAQALPTIKQFIFNSSTSFSSLSQSGVDVGLWTLGGQTLVLATNLGNASASLSLALPGGSSSKATATQILDGGGSLQLGGAAGAGGNATLNMDALGSAGFVVQ